MIIKFSPGTSSHKLNVCHLSKHIIVHTTSTFKFFAVKITFFFLLQTVFVFVCNCLLAYQSIFLFKVQTSIDIILWHKGKPKKLILTLYGPEFTFCCPGKTCIMLLVNVSVVSDGF